MFLFQKKLCQCFCLLFSIVLVETTLQKLHASQKEFEVAVDLVDRQSTLLIEIEDAANLPNACDYYVQYLEYLKPLNSLIVELSQEDCPVDRYGTGKAILHWSLPNSLKIEAKLFLILNQKKVGTIHIEGRQVKFLSLDRQVN